VEQTPSNPFAHSKPKTGQASRFADFVLIWVCRFSAASILVMLVALVFVLTRSSWPAIQTYGASFLTGTTWRPNERTVPVRDEAGKIVFEDGEQKTQTLPPEFGALPVVWGTLVSSLVALVFAVPLSMGCALFLVRIAPPWIEKPVSFLVEFLAAIPSIAFGLWGLFILAPFLQGYAEPFAKWLLGSLGMFNWMFFDSSNRPIALTGRDMLCGGLILGIMIVPIITAISRDVLRAVPRHQIEGSLALGATWWQSCIEMLKFAKAGLFGAVMLGFARAAGETMAVAMVIGNNNQISPSPFAPAQTMASLLANEFAEASVNIHLSALTMVALLLLIMSLTLNIIARYLVVGGASAKSRE
jgi:phosphate transport system permease protein